MHVHLTRESEILALHETNGNKEWKKISIKQLEAGLMSMKGMTDVMVYCSADNPEEFAVNPPQNSKVIVRVMQSFGLPITFLRTPIVPVSSSKNPKDNSTELFRQSDYDGSPILRVSVFKNGSFWVNGKSSTMGELDALLAVHAIKHGVVWYYREGGQEELPPQAMQVLDLIMKHERPISLSSKADFSDVIDGDGRSVPRKK